MRCEWNDYHNNNNDNNKQSYAEEMKVLLSNIATTDMKPSIPTKPSLNTYSNVSEVIGYRFDSKVGICINLLCRRSRFIPSKKPPSPHAYLLSTSLSLSIYLVSALPGVNGENKNFPMLLLGRCINVYMACMRIDADVDDLFMPMPTTRGENLARQRHR